MSSQTSNKLYLNGGWNVHFKRYNNPDLRIFAEYKCASWRIENKWIKQNKIK